MEEISGNCQFSDEDLEAALKELKGYVDITEDDLKKIYAIALRHASQRVARRIVVRDVMTQDVIHVRDDADITEVENLLSEKKIKRLPVVDEQGRLVGLISRADIARVIGAK